MKRAIVLLLLGACTGSSPQPIAKPPIVTSATPPVPEAMIVDAGPIDSGVAIADTGKPPPKLVLHAGDSMVGGTMGLGRALHKHFTEMGSRVVRDVWVSINIEGFARHPRFAKLLTDNAPDLVILTLGANDFYVPSPKSLAPFVRSIVKRASKDGTRECYWIVPVPWTKAKETGIVEVIQANGAPCRVFTGANLKLDRTPDGIHPTNTGGEQWANAFLEFYEERE